MNASLIFLVSLILFCCVAPASTKTFYLLFLCILPILSFFFFCFFALFPIISHFRSHPLSLKKKREKKERIPAVPLIPYPADACSCKYTFSSDLGVSLECLS